LSVVGIGIDIVSVERIAKLLEGHGERFLGRCFRMGDLLSVQRDRETAAKPDAAFLAGRWAAKEALLKALGDDVRGVPYRDIEVARGANGPVGLVLHGRAREALATAGGNRIHLTISHEREFAVASVLIEG
jgi:holo-[acyl-carrier protein] synthase